MTTKPDTIHAVAILAAAHRAVVTAMHATRSAEYLHTAFPNSITDHRALIDAQDAQDLANQAYGAALYTSCRMLGIESEAVRQAITDEANAQTLPTADDLGISL